MIRTKDLRLPKGLNLDILANLLPDDAFDSLIKDHASRPRKDRRIVLPSKICLRKCIIHFLVEKYKGDFSKVMEALRGEDRVLADKGLHIGNVKRMWLQRKKEILREKMKNKYE